MLDDTPATVTDLLGRTLRLWWGELLPLVLLNILWFAFQLPIITAPIATAVVYAVARKVVDDDLAMAAKLGVSGTPSFFVNGRFLSGAQPYASFARVIDEELAKN